MLRIHLIWRVILALFVLMPMAAAAQQIITVDDDGPADYDNIQAAINHAVNGDTVEVKPGTYTGPGNRDIDFLGKAITLRSVDPNDPDIVATTIIDCQGTRTNPHRGFNFDGSEDGNSVLAGLTVTNGFATDGGAIACENSSPTITNCVFTTNTAGYSGGAIYNTTSSSPTLSNCVFAGNSTRDWILNAGGAGVFNYRDSSPNLQSCTFINNSTAVMGGGMCNIYGCSPTLNGCTFLGNSAASGGALSNLYGEPNLLACVFSGNSCSAVYGGGAIVSSQSILNMRDCILSGNSAQRHGGGMANYKTCATLINCFFAVNSALDYAGAIASITSDVNLGNCTFSGNVAPKGSAVACDSGANQSNLQLTNRILWGDRKQIWNNDGSTITITYSDVRGSWPGEGNMNLEPKLAFLDDYHLMPGSPCIDVGTNNPNVPLPASDIDGNPRLLDGDGDANVIVDIGAHEYHPQVPCVAFSPRSLRFFGIEGGSNPATKMLSVRNGAGGNLHWEIDAPYWLMAEPDAGTSSGEVHEIAIWPDISGLSRGRYYGTIRISDPCAVNHPQELPVALQLIRTLSVPPEYSTIQTAIDDAIDDDVVIISPGTYTGPGNRDIDFFGKAITVRSTNPNDPEIVAATVIDCNGTRTDPHRGFSFRNNEGPDSLLNGLTITNGYGLAHHWHFWPPKYPLPSAGGAIFCENASPTIANCMIFANSGSYWGGGIYCEDSRAIIRDCSILRNGAGSGGAIHCYQADPLIINCTISENSAGSGGGVHCERSWPTIANCHVAENRANMGAGIYCYDWSGPVIINCTITGNYVEGIPLYPAEGGAIYCAWSNPLIFNSNLMGNSARYGGGIFCYADSEPKITNSILRGNRATYGSEIALRVYSRFPPMPCPEPSTLTVSHSNIQGGQAAAYVVPDCTLVWGSDNIDADACFVEPGYWDPNDTLADANDDFWVDGDYDLLADSPCIDEGNNSSLPTDVYDLDGDGNTTEQLPWDLDGNPRIVDGDNDGNSVVDMGAYEFYLPPIEVPMKFTPQAVNPGSQGRWFKLHFVLPEGFAVEGVDVNEPALCRLIDTGDVIESNDVNVFVNEEGLVEIEASFERGAFSLCRNRQAERNVTVLGLLAGTGGQDFYGTDNIRIINKTWGHLAGLALHWLEEGCGEPDWCGGQDLNQDGTVDFVDLALFDDCCIEILAE